MSKIDNNPLLKGASGMLGDTMFYRTINGQIQMANKPKKRKFFSPRQREIQAEFFKARNYAKRQLLNPDFRKLYETGVTLKKKSAYLVAMSDYLNAPEIDMVDTLSYKGNVGDVIEVEARDDFMVTAVKISITDGDGNLLEEGDARQAEIKEVWSYKATVANLAVKGSVVKAIAFDRPGNSTPLEVVL
jgi:hypothetical protein